MFLAEGTPQTKSLSREQALCFLRKRESPVGAEDRIGRDDARKETWILQACLDAAHIIE